MYSLIPDSATDWYIDWLTGRLGELLFFPCTYPGTNLRISCTFAAAIERKPFSDVLTDLVTQCPIDALSDLPSYSQMYLFTHRSTERRIYTRTPRITYSLIHAHTHASTDALTHALAQFSSPYPHFMRGAAAETPTMFGSLVFLLSRSIPTARMGRKSGVSSGAGTPCNDVPWPNWAGLQGMGISK